MASVFLSPEELKARTRRNVWIALALVAFMVLLFTTTMLRMLHNQKAARESHAAASAGLPVAAAPAVAAPVAPSAPANGG